MLLCFHSYCGASSGKGGSFQLQDKQLHFTQMLFNLYVTLLGEMAGVWGNMWSVMTLSSYFSLSLESAKVLGCCHGAVMDSMRTNELNLNPGKMGSLWFCGVKKLRSWGNMIHRIHMENSDFSVIAWKWLAGSVRARVCLVMRRQGHLHFIFCEQCLQGHAGLFPVTVVTRKWL